MAPLNSLVKVRGACKLSNQILLPNGLLLGSPPPYIHTQPQQRAYWEDRSVPWGETEGSRIESGQYTLPIILLQ